jgi:hypothetical protein
MSKANWFAHYERLESEHPEKNDEELSEMASEAQVDEMADRADMLNDEKWLYMKDGNE